MSADNTANKRRAFIHATDNPFDVLPCPTCNEPMAIDLAHALHAVDDGKIASNAAIRWAELSHTVPASDGGNEFAIECNRCNRDRGNEEWAPDATVPTFEVRSKDYRPNRLAVQRCKGGRAWLASEGYPVA